MNNIKQAASAADNIPGRAPGGMKIVGIGEVLWDILPEGKKMGGAPANFAYHVAQFGFDSVIASAVGHDRNGEELLSCLKEKSLSLDIPQVDYPTGSVMVEVDEMGVPSYDIKENVAWDNIPFTNSLACLASQTCAVSFGSLGQRNFVSRQTIKSFLEAMPSGKGIYKIFDINLRQSFYTPEIVEESMRNCNVLKINDEELVCISRMFGYPGIDLQDKCWILLGKYDLDILILTCGVNGSYIFTPGNISFVETPQVEVEDTVGAGDSFTAAFISALLSGKSVSEAHRMAVNVSAYVCTQAGAMPPLPGYYTNQG